MKRAGCALVILLASAVLGVRGAADGREGGSRPPISEVVYPASPRGLAMSHRTPAHRELPCTRCHASAPSSRVVSDELRPREASCEPCHAERIDRANTSAATCDYCHRGFDPARSTAVAPSRSLPARLVFSHAAHERARVPCEGCHGTAGEGEPRLPLMAQCIACHEQQKRTLACNGCHLSLPSGRLRVAFSDGKLVPKGSWLGMAHDSDFIVRHRWLAADHGAVCASCHTEQECAACHDGQRRPRNIHPNDYLALHAQDARRTTTRCVSCHATQSFCLSCHARLGVSPVTAPDLASPKRFHPSGQRWIRGPGSHGHEAQRSLQSCVSCHAERDCIACHASTAPGVKSPHPAGFAATCRSRLEQNPRACAACHGSLVTLRQRCW